MTTLRSGKRSCNAICHSATGRVCRCICQGHYHGIDWRSSDELEREPPIAKPQRLSKEKLEQIPLFAGIPAW